MTLRVLQIVAAATDGGTGRAGVNGPERRTLNALGAWAAHGVEPVVAYPRRGRLWDRFAASGVPLVDYEIGSKLDWRAVPAIRDLARRFGAGVLHTQGPGSLDALAGVAAAAARRPLVVTRPVMIEELGGVSPLRRAAYAAVDRRALRRAAVVVAVSRAGAEHLRRVTRVPPRRVRLVYNGIDLARFAPRAGGGGGPLRLGMAAQLTPVKGLADFVEVVARLLARGLSVHATLIGDGPLRDRVAADVAARGLGGAVELVGHTENVAARLGELDLFLFTSHREGLSVAILEAMASGLPVVATDVGGTREQVVEGENGFVRAAGDVEGLAEACARLAGSAALRERMGRASRARAEALFSAEGMVAGYAACYHDAYQGKA